MTKSITIQIDQEYIGTRYDHAISQIVHNISRTKIQKLMADGQILTNGIPILCCSQKIKKECTITVLDDPDTDKILDKINAPQPENIEINIVYEDEYIAIINKPSGMVCHPAPGNYDGTLLNAIMYRFNTQDVGPQCRYGIVHRLDKDTSGLILIAKTEDAHYIFSKMFLPFENKSITRKYICFCNNTPNPKSGIINNLITRNPNNRQEYIVADNIATNSKQLTHSHMDIIRNKKLFKNQKQDLSPTVAKTINAKQAITCYKTLGEHYYTPNKSISMVECILKTGRTHQIRVHMKHIGCHIIGDKVYGVRNNQLAPAFVSSITRQALHSYKMEFTHPFLNKSMQFIAEIPDDLSDIEKIFHAT